MAWVMRMERCLDRRIINQRGHCVATLFQVCFRRQHFRAPESFSLVAAATSRTWFAAGDQRTFFQSLWIIVANILVMAQPSTSLPYR